MFWQKRSICLDIGEYSIKAIELNIANEVVNISKKQLPSNLFNKGLIKDKASIIKILKDIISNVKNVILFIGVFI